ncbi:MAG: hypothetical protein ACYC0Y_13040 [Pirellulales bacterium]
MQNPGVDHLPGGRGHGAGAVQAAELVAPLEVKAEGSQNAVQFRVGPAQRSPGFGREPIQQAAVAKRLLQLGQKPADLLGQRVRTPQVDRALPAGLAIGQLVVRAEPRAAARSPRGDDASLPGKDRVAVEDLGSDRVEGLSHESKEQGVRSKERQREAPAVPHGSSQFSVFSFQSRRRTSPTREF